MTKPLLRDTIGLTAAVLLSAAITASMALAAMMTMTTTRGVAAYPRLSG